jgi:IrrE N-terminal-like domain
VVEFDPTVWRERSWARFVERSPGASPRQGKKLQTQWAEDVLGIYAIGLLVEWCTARGIGVRFAKRTNGVYDSQTKSIVISHRASPLRQAIYLSHECGHHLIGDAERFSDGYYVANQKHVNKTFKHKLACLEEEIEAWNRARKLLERLGATLPYEKFESVRVECLKSYVKWAGRQGT